MISAVQNKSLAYSLLAYALTLAGLYTILTFFGYIRLWPDNVNLTLWDADWYDSVHSGGYYYSEEAQSNSAFFPLFPYLWRLTHLSPIGISVFNFLLFCASLILLARAFDIPRDLSLLFVSFPSSIFFMLPYTESLFFFCVTLFLIGFRRENQALIIVGLLLASVTRATAMFFIPAILVMELFFHGTILSKKFFRNSILFSLISIVGIAIVVWIQYFQTGVLFAFARQQFKYWGHKFSMPGFPLVTWDDARTKWLECLALIVSLNALAVILYLFWLLITKKRERAEEILTNRPYIFSAIYCIMVMIYVIFFNPHDQNGKTSMSSYNRYLFSTPFFFVFIHYTFVHFNIGFKRFMVFTIICLLAFFAVGMTGAHPWLRRFFEYPNRRAVYYFFIYIYSLIVFSFSRDYSGRKELMTGLTVINIILQAALIESFISAKWVA